MRTLLRLAHIILLGIIAYSIITLTDEVRRVREVIVTIDEDIQLAKQIFSFREFFNQ